MFLRKIKISFLFLYFKNKRDTVQWCWPTFIDGPGETPPLVCAGIKQALDQWLWCLASANGEDLSLSPGEGWQTYWLLSSHWLAWLPFGYQECQSVELNLQRKVSKTRGDGGKDKNGWSWASQLYEEGTPTSTLEQCLSPPARPKSTCITSICIYICN